MTWLFEAICTDYAAASQPDKGLQNIKQNIMGGIYEEFFGNICGEFDNVLCFPFIWRSFYTSKLLGDACFCGTDNRGADNGIFITGDKN
jgi:hypothetical protein